MRPTPLLLLGACLFAGRNARADNGPPAPPDAHAYSKYELTTLHDTLSNRKLEIDLSPDGKVVEAIDVVPLNVIENRDPAPDFLNWFHATSQKSVIEREVLLQPGDRYDAARVAETARNLRNLPQLSLVLIVPVKGSSADRVRLLVITKDVWSLRLNFNLQFAGGKLQYLLLQPSEENLLGTQQSVSLLFTLNPGAYSLGGAYSIPRVAGSRIAFSANANAIINRDTGATEGSSGGFSYGQPLYSTDAKWAWNGTVNWYDYVARRFVGGELATYDAASTPQQDNIPYEYRSNSIAGAYSVTRSFGSGIKHDVTLTMGASRNLYHAYDLSAFAPSAAAEFRSILPVSDTQIGPKLNYHTYSTEFLTVLDFNTLGLQEDYRLGHEAFITLSPVTKALNSSRDFLGVDAGAQYTVALGKDGLARTYVQPSIELADGFPDASLEVGARLMSPRYIFGRIVFDGFWLERFHDYLNTRSALGGNTRLRGYPTYAFTGKNAVAYNLELRSRALEILTCQLGGVLFYDAGDAFDLPERMNLKHSAGFGLRALFPQLDRTVFRVDWGFPFDKQFAAKSSFPGDIVVTFDQAFAMPAVPVPNPGSTSM